MKTFSLFDIAHRELSSARTGEKFSLSAVLSDLVEFKNLFIHHEILPPGRRSSAPHSHSKQEEMIWVLTGNPTAHLSDHAAQLKPGDFIGFQPSTSELHFLENSTDFEASVLVIASKPLEDSVQYVTREQK